MKPCAMYVSSRWPWPPRSGRNTMICQTLQALAQDFSIIFVAIGAKPESDSGTSDVDEVNILNNPNVFEVFWNFIIRWDWSLQERLFFSVHNSRAILRLCRARDVKVIVVDMVRISPYLNGHHGIIKVCDMDDLLSRRYRQLSMLKTGNYSLFGTYGRSGLFALFNNLSKLLVRPILRLESWLIKQREIKLVRLVDLVLLVSPLEALRLGTLARNPEKVVGFPPAMPVLPNHPRLGAADLHLTSDGPFTLLFVGDMRTPANKLAVNFILDDILPALRASRLKYQMIIVGRADIRLTEKIKNTLSASHLGWVDDLTDVYRKTDIVLCPFIIGTGIKLKVLEAMAHAKAVITDNLGSEGITARDGKEFILAEGSQAVVKAINLLSRDAGLRAQLGSAARAFVTKYHNSSNLQNILREQLRQKLHPKSFPQTSSQTMDVSLLHINTPAEQE